MRHGYRIICTRQTQGQKIEKLNNLKEYGSQRTDEPKQVSHNRLSIHVHMHSHRKAVICNDKLATLKS